MCEILDAKAKQLATQVRGTRNDGIVAQRQHSFGKVLSLQTRRQLLRTESRTVHLARAFIKGVPYKAVEQSCIPGNEPAVAEIAVTLGQSSHDFKGKSKKATIQAWLEAA